MKIKHALQEYLLEIEVRKYTQKIIEAVTVIGHRFCFGTTLRRFCGIFVMPYSISRSTPITT